MRDYHLLPASGWGHPGLPWSGPVIRVSKWAKGRINIHVIQRLFIDCSLMVVSLLLSFDLLLGGCLFNTRPTLCSQTLPFERHS